MVQENKLSVYTMPSIFLDGNCMVPGREFSGCTMFVVDKGYDRSVDKGYDFAVDIGCKFPVDKGEAGESWLGEGSPWWKFSGKDGKIRR